MDHFGDFWTLNFPIHQKNLECKVSELIYVIYDRLNISDYVHSIDLQRQHPVLENLYALISLVQLSLNTFLSHYVSTTRCVNLHLF